MAARSGGVFVLSEIKPPGVSFIRLPAFAEGCHRGQKIPCELRSYGRAKRLAATTNACLKEPHPCKLKSNE
jgi:hypothetical protein